MIVYRTTIEVKGLRGEDIYDFLLNCTDEQYQRWWPGTHLAFHTIKRTPTSIGNIVHMDEYVGDFHLTLHGIVKRLVPNREIVLQIRGFGVSWPAWISLTFSDMPAGVNIIHTVSAGYRGIGSFLDVFLRLYFSSKFEQQMAEHAITEFNRLRDVLHELRGQWQTDIKRRS